MGDAASNHPVLAPASGLGQSNLDAGGFIALDVGALSSLAGDGPDTTTTTVAAATPRTPRAVRSLSRKGSERKQADGDTNGTAGGGGGVGTGGDRPPLSPLFVHVAAADDGLRLAHTPGAVGTPGGKSRRLGRRPAPWLDPRRVVFLFATLSSVGTLILLYFTLSMSKMDSAGSGTGATDSDAR